MNIIYRLGEKILFQHAGGPCKFPQATGAFRAAKVAAGGGLKGYGNRVTPLHGLFSDLADVITGEDLYAIPCPCRRELAYKVYRVIEIKVGHSAKIAF